MRSETRSANEVLRFLKRVSWSVGTIYRPFDRSPHIIGWTRSRQRTTHVDVCIRLPFDFIVGRDDESPVFIIEEITLPTGKSPPAKVIRFDFQPKSLFLSDNHYKR